MKKIITEQDIREAAASAKLVLVKPGAIVTPLAKDTAAELNVRIEPDRSAPPEPELPQDIPQVKVVAIASDHGGFALKQELIPYLHDLGYIAHDLGPASDAACDYPDFAFKVAEAVADKKVDMGIMIDSVGIGSAMAANRVKGVLAAKCNNTFEAHSAREHNYANLLTLGAKIIGSEMAKSIVKTFLETPGGAERHQRRISKILDRQA
jgi:ribose 5-phosphate isomerase B